MEKSVLHNENTHENDRDLTNRLRSSMTFNFLIFIMTENP